MLGHSIVSQHFMEPEGSIPNSPPVPILSQTNPVYITPSHLAPTRSIMLSLGVYIYTCITLQFV
jgi:hypothetical protein